jgi:hypothetical protein
VELGGLKTTKILVKHASNNDSDKGNHLLLEMLRAVRSNNPFFKICKQLYTLNLDPYSLIIDLSFWNKEMNHLEVSFVFGLFLQILKYSKLC